jgi:hypothetical protein
MMLAIAQKSIHGFSTILNSSGVRQPFVQRYSQDRKVLGAGYYTISH